jgi:hypothetical protein
VFGRLDTLGGFFLKRVDDPDFVSELHGLHYAEGIALERHRDLKDAGPHTVQRLRDIRFGAFGGNGERAVRQIERAASGKSWNSFRAALSHEIGRVSGQVSGIPIHDLLCYVVIFDNDCQ